MKNEVTGKSLHIGGNTHPITSCFPKLFVTLVWARGQQQAKCGPSLNPDSVLSGPRAGTNLSLRLSGFQRLFNTSHLSLIPHFNVAFLVHTLFEGKQKK